MVQQVLGIVWRDIRLHAVENLRLVILVGKYRFGNYLAGNARNFLLVVAVGLDSPVQESAVFAI